MRATKGKGPLAGAAAVPGVFPEAGCVAAVQDFRAHCRSGSWALRVIAATRAPKAPDLLAPGDPPGRWGAPLGPGAGGRQQRCRVLTGALEQ